MKRGQRGKERKKGKMLQRLALPKEGESCWETPAAIRVRRQRSCWEEIQRLEAAAERCGRLSGEAEARECKHCPGLCLWAVALVFADAI